MGIQPEHSELETKLYFDNLLGGNFDVAINNISDFADDPSAQFNTLLSKKVSAREVDPAKRLSLVNDFERYSLTQAYSVPLLWYQRIVVNHKKIKGWDLQPSHYIGQALVDVWLDE